MKRYIICSLLCLFINIHNIYAQPGTLTSKTGCNCSYLTPTIEVWNHTGGNYIIGDWGNKKDQYSKSHGWNSYDFPYPKMFDLKLTVVNNPILYDNPARIGNRKVSVILKLKVGQNKDAIYTLNSFVIESIPLIKEKLINDLRFKKGDKSVDHIDIWQRNIPFEYLYKKYQQKKLFIEQFLFEIIFSANNCSCNYEYAFPMAENEEP